MVPAAVALLGVLIQTAAPSGATVTGVVLDEISRAPVAGARVNLLPSAQRRETPLAPTPHTTTSADGRFAFSNVAPGEYSLSASRDGYTFRMLPSVAIEGAATVEVPVALMAPAAAIVGRILGPDGEAVADAVVIPQRRLRQPANPAPGSRPGPRFDSIVPRDMTDDVGRFAVHGVPPGEYVIRISGGRPRRSSGALDGRSERIVPGWYPGTPDPDGAVTVVTTAGGTIDLGDIQMATTAAFRVSGQVLDDAGHALANVHVRLVPHDSPRNAMPLGAPEMSDADGSFVLDAVLPGRYLLVAVPPAPTVTNHPGGPGFNKTSWQIGGRTPESAAGSIWTVTRHGITRQYRDERATTVPVDVADAPVTTLRVTITRP